MKEIEKLKTQKIIDKVINGNFDENDVDNLFMRLRAYSNGFKVFREIADFVAHNDTRDRGIINESLEEMYLSYKYFLEFNSKGNKLDLSKAFPIWIKKHINFQIEKADEKKLKEEYNVSKERLKTRVKKAFKENNNGSCILINDMLSQLTLQAISYVMSFISVKPAYSQNELIEETLEVIKKNNFIIKTDEFKIQSNFFTLCTLLLLHNSKFNFKGYKEGYCKISAENESIPLNRKFIDLNINKKDHKEGYGNLGILGHIILNVGKKDLTFCYNIMSTELKAEQYCDNSLFIIEPINNEFTEHLVRRIKFGENLFIKRNRQLSQ